MAEAIKALEFAGVLTWVNRIVRERVRERDLFGHWGTRWRVVRTSNGYTFPDPNPAAQASKSENPPGTVNQGFLISETPAAVDQTALDGPLAKALAALRTAMEARGPVPGT